MKNLPKVVIKYHSFSNPEYIEYIRNRKGDNPPDACISEYVMAEVLQWNINKGSMRIRLVESKEFPFYKWENVSLI